MRRDLNSVTSDLLLLYNISVETELVTQVLDMIQDELDPPGIAARDLQESVITSYSIHYTKLYEWKRRKIIITVDFLTLM